MVITSHTCLHQHLETSHVNNFNAETKYNGSEDSTCLSSFDINFETCVISACTLLNDECIFCNAELTYNCACNWRVAMSGHFQSLTHAT
eukprot:m.133886 g.133886  ORF g.133886 m.133886 type:complete len:89 (-) comp13949_c2_seq13:1797-2063(-)